MGEMSEVDVVKRIARLRKQGLSWRKIAKRVGVSHEQARLLYLGSLVSRLGTASVR